MTKPNRTLLHRGTAMGPATTMGIIAGSSEVAKDAAIEITANITLDTMANIAMEHMIAIPIAKPGTTRNTGITTAGTVAAYAIGMVGSTMDTAATSSLVAEAVGAIGDTMDEAGLVTTPVDDVMNTMATSLPIGADGVTTAPEIIMDITGTSSPIGATGDTDDGAATVITLAGDITDVTATSLLIAAAGAIADTVTDITLDGTSDIAGMSSPIAVVVADITADTMRSACITVTITSSLTADIGGTKLTEALNTHITLPDDTTGTGATGLPIMAAGGVVAGELAMRQAGAVRATNTTLVLVTRRIVTRRAMTRKLMIKRKLASRQQGARGDLVLRSRHGCWNMGTRTKTAS